MINSLFEVISTKDGWNGILQQYSVTDVYYQYEYAKSMADHIKGSPLMINYSVGKSGFFYVIIVQDIANDSRFTGYIEKNTFFDAETPYGYGGPVFYGDFQCTDAVQQDFWQKLKDGLLARGVVSQFVRYYPFFFIDDKSKIICDKTGTNKSTVYMDLSSRDIIRNHLDGQYRRKIRKAREAGVTIIHDHGERIKDFIRLYTMTMDMHNAADMYYFGEEYYDYLISDFSDHEVLFYAVYEGKIVGASFFLYDSKYMHFHLGGRDINAPNIPFENLIMVEAALWGSRCGIEKLHIGGGLTDRDSLFQYKKKFNRQGIKPFYIGRSIFDQSKYEKLLQIRKENDHTFQMDNSNYIQYRY